MHSGEAIGDNRNAVCENRSCVSYRVAQELVPSQVAPGGTGVVSALTVDLAIH
jgi:hypothetical protein